MARPRISPAVLADKGVPLTLADGLEVTLCFSFKALMLLEERYGSLEQAAALMGGASPTGETATVADSSGVISSGPVQPATGAAPFKTVAGILACGLAHEVTPAEDDGRPLDDLNVLADYLETDKITVYSDAISAAFSKAFPQDPTEAGSTDTPPAETTTEDSRGESGTGSLESGSTSETTSSGA